MPGPPQPSPFDADMYNNKSSSKRTTWHHRNASIRALEIKTATVTKKIFPPVIEKEEAPFKWICYWRQHKEASLCLQICAAGNVLCPHHALFLSVQSDWNRWKVFPEFRGLKEAQDKSSKQLSASETREMSKLTRAVSQRQPFTGQTLDTRRITAPNIVINPYFWLIMLACCYLLIQSLTLIAGKSDQDVKTAKKRENVFIKILISPVCIC